MSEYRAGLMSLDPRMANRVRAFMPPEHRIAATRYHPDIETDEWLVEGPLLPVVPAGEAPPVVVLLLTAHWDPNRIHLDVCWADCYRNVQSPSWSHGEWPDMDTYRAHLETLD